MHSPCPTSADLKDATTRQESGRSGTCNSQAELQNVDLLSRRASIPFVTCSRSGGFEGGRRRNPPRGRFVSMAHQNVRTSGGGSMEQLVEEHAAKLWSDEPDEIIEQFRRLEMQRYDAYQKGYDWDPSARLGYSRLLQELLAYKRGALVQKLLNQATETKNPASGVPAYMQLASVLALAALTESQASASFCTRDEKQTQRFTCAVLKSFFRVLTLATDEKSRKSKDDQPWVGWTLASVRGIVNFARVSKHFRLNLQNYGHPLFASLELLLLEAFEKSISSEIATYPMKEIEPLMHTFWLFEDSQQWAIEQGLIRIQVALRKKVRRNLTGMAEQVGDPTGLMRMFSPEERSRMLESKEQELLDLDRQIRCAEDPERARALRSTYLEECKEELVLNTQLSPRMDAKNGRCVEGDMRNLDIKKTPKSVKSLAAWASRRREMPIVCSWELCETGSVIDAGRLFSKCSKCALAYYCR